MKTLLFSFVLLFCAGLLCAQTSVTPKNTLPLPKAISSAKAVFLNTIDPAVTGISFATIKQPTGDKLRVTGKVKNIGGKNYVSSDNQQIVQLWEIRSATSKLKLKEIPFRVLNAGQEITLSIELPAIKPGTEFPPDYQVVIVYDPDIYIDANKNNDDARSDNNSHTKNPFN